MIQSLIYEDFLKAINHQQPERVPVNVWNTRCNLVRVPGAKNLLDYYKNVDIKLKSQVFPLEHFEDCLILPGVWPDYGVVLEASAFGSPIRWDENNPPHAMNYMESLEDFKKMKPINPHEDGLMPQALKEYAYMLKNLDKKLVKKLYYLDGCALVTGPLEVAAATLGHSKLYIDFYDKTALVEEFLEFITDGIIRYLKELEKIAGELKLVSMIEHCPGQITPDQFEQFAVPYISRIYQEFPNAIGLYHNEDNVNHVLSRLPAFGAKIWHCGDVDLAQAKEAIGDKMTLMGNLKPIEVLLKGTPDDVTEASRKCLETMSGNGGYILCSGGGLAPGTTLENVNAMVQAARGGK
mgnify:CR=1 FL=1